MNFVSVRCPNCNSNLSVDDGLDTFYCQYCGSKIMLEGQSAAAYNAKVKVKKMEHQERVKEKEYEQERYKIKSEKKTDMTILAFSIFLFLLGMSIIGFIGISGSTGAKKQEQKLEGIVQEIKEDIENENFGDAYIKANMLYWDNSWTSEGEEKWDSIRKETIKQIKQAEKEANKQSSLKKNSDSNNDNEKSGLLSWFNKTSKSKE